MGFVPPRQAGDLSYLLNRRETEAMKVYRHMFKKRRSTSPAADKNLIVFLGDNPQKRLVWSLYSGKMPTFRRNTGLLWSFALRRWVTPSERLATLGFPVSAEMARAMGVPPLPVRDPRRASKMAGNGMHLACLTVVQMIALRLLCSGVILRLRRSCGPVKKHPLCCKKTLKLSVCDVHCTGHAARESQSDTSNCFALHPQQPLWPQPVVSPLVFLREMARRTTAIVRQVSESDEEPLALPAPPRMRSEPRRDGRATPSARSFTPRTRLAAPAPAAEPPSDDGEGSSDFEWPREQ